MSAERGVEELAGADSHEDAVFEELVGDDPVAVNEVGPGERDAVPGVIVGWDEGVEDPEALDDLALRIGEKRIVDPVGCGEVCECVRFVLGHCIEGDASGLEIVEVLLQLDQLRAARRSPHRGAVDGDGARCRLRAEPPLSCAAGAWPSEPT